MSIKLRPLFFLMLMFMVACAPVVKLVTQGSPTLFPLSTAVVETITARAVKQGSSKDELATAYANATALSQQAVNQAESDKASFQATSTAIVPVLKELPNYGVNPLDGGVAWLHNPVTIDVTGYMQYGYANDYSEITASDFVMASDITWNTQYGSSGCGFMFHSNGNKESPSQFMVLLTRSANGTLVITTLVDGNLINTQSYPVKPNDKTFNWLNDSTNHFAIVVHGKLVDLYTNGKFIGQADTTKPPTVTIPESSLPELPDNPSEVQLQEYQQMLDQSSQIISEEQANLILAQQNYSQGKVASMTDGFLGFIALSESGRSVCKFSNAWMFKSRSIPTSTPTSTSNGTITPTQTPLITPTLITTPVLPTKTPLGGG
jgi:hypothetical protein